MIPTIPEYPPECPKCGSEMQLIKPDESQNWDAFWGCTDYTNNKCRGTRQLDPRTGLPSLTPEEEDCKLLEWIRTEHYPDPGAEI